jgi:protein-L-isoaspartate(D-aspartate) O-methyltransferase
MNNEEATMDRSTVYHYQHCLASHLRAKQPLSEAVFEAFLHVPRHAFLTHYYRHQAGTRAWTRYEREESEAWYAAVYQDQGLVTWIDEHGRALSSSSQPGVMAQMLEALDVQPGMRVLEIGTGTGYNAGLLAALTKDPSLVTTLDIDLKVVEQAKQALMGVVGEGMSVVVGNGAQGYRAHAPYDRIVVTASTPVLPGTWREQLAPDGLLVCVLQPRYATLGGIMKAQHGERGLAGRIIGPASFMALHDEPYRKRTIQIDGRAPLVGAWRCEPEMFPPSLLREDPHFAFFLYAALPDLYVFQKPKEGAIVYYQEAFPQGYIVFQQSSSCQVELHGEPSCAEALWKHLLTVYRSWRHYREPRITQYHYEMEPASGKQGLVLPPPLGAYGPLSAESALVQWNESDEGCLWATPLHL